MPRLWGSAAWWVKALLVYGATRVVSTLLLLWVAEAADPRSPVGAHPGFLRLSTIWDGTFYLRIVQHGYPSTLPVNPDGGTGANPWAFLPVYPALVRLLDPSGDTSTARAAAVGVSLVAGFGAAVLLALLLKPRIGDSSAVFAVAVFGCSPLGFLLQIGYAESLGLLVLFGLLVLVDRGRYLTAVPVAIVLSFTRPGMQAVALMLGILLAARWVQTRRGRDDVTPSALIRGVVLTVVVTVSGWFWPTVAGIVTGDPDAYLKTEMAWRGTAFVPVQPWIWFVRAYLGHWLGPIVLAVLVLAFMAALLSAPVRRLGPVVQLWSAAWVSYLILVIYPGPSTFRLLMPLAPLAGALTPTRTPARVTLLAVLLVLQALWLWHTFGSALNKWTVP